MRIALFALLYCSSTVLPLFGADPSTVAVTKTSFRSGGQTIDLDHYEPAAPGRHPRILVLHGAGGMVFDGPQLRGVAQALAENGNSVDLVHYFNRTRTLFARDATMQKNFESWLATVRDGISHAAAESHGVVGVYGYSLGAFLAVAAASDNPQVGAIVEHAGGIWNNRNERIGKMPPVLVIHGREDQRVPYPKYAEPLLRHLQTRSAHVEKRIFAAEGHGFSPSAMAEVRQQATAFFRQQLRR